MKVVNSLVITDEKLEGLKKNDVILNKKRKKIQGEISNIIHPNHRVYGFKHLPTLSIVIQLSQNQIKFRENLR